MSNKGYERVPWSLCFLECHWLLSTFKTSSGSNESMASLGCQCPCLCNQGHADRCLNTKFCGLRTRGSTVTLKLTQGKHVMEASAGAVESLFTRVTSAHTCAPLSRQMSHKHGSKIKLLTVSRQGEQSFKPSLGSFQVQGLHGLHTHETRPIAKHGKILITSCLMRKVPSKVVHIDSYNFY